MSKEPKKIQLNTVRRFGTEIEINAFDLRSRPFEGKTPEGMHDVAFLVKKLTDSNVTIHKWSNDHYNNNWIVKPDGSCGLEVCSPVLKGNAGIAEVCKVVEGFKQDSRIYSDDRCSFHLHVDVSDLNIHEVATILTWWIKCEMVFMDAMPNNRKLNHYCQVIGFANLLNNIEKDLVSDHVLIQYLGKCKYYSINAYHYNYHRRNTIEFRIMDHGCCLDEISAKNWIRLILHFIERSLCHGKPKNYEPNNSFTSYCWLDPKEVFDLLGFTGECELSEELIEVRSWFLQRLHDFCQSSKEQGIFSKHFRKIAWQQIKKLRKSFV